MGVVLVVAGVMIHPLALARTTRPVVIPLLLLGIDMKRFALILCVLNLVFAVLNLLFYSMLPFDKGFFNGLIALLNIFFFWLLAKQLKDGDFD